MILGGAVQVANGIGTLRNRFSDAHGRSGPKPVRPTARHESLAVNVAGRLPCSSSKRFWSGSGRAPGNLRSMESLSNTNGRSGDARCGADRLTSMQ